MLLVFLLNQGLFLNEVSFCLSWGTHFTRASEAMYLSESPGSLWAPFFLPCTFKGLFACFLKTYDSLLHGSLPSNGISVCWTYLTCFSTTVLNLIASWSQLQSSSQGSSSPVTSCSSATCSLICVVVVSYNIHTDSSDRVNTSLK